MEIKHLAQLGTYTKTRSVPHINGPGLVQFLTYRRIRESTINLCDPNLARTIERSWKYFDGDRYELFAWVIMPDHVHLIIKPLSNWSIPSIIQSQKRYSARIINQIAGRAGSVWQKEYWDVVLRDRDELVTRVRYILENPVRSGLSGDFRNWEYSGCNESLLEEVMKPIGFVK